MEPGHKRAQDPPGSLHARSIVVGGVNFPKGEGSAVIHSKKNYLLQKDATYMWFVVFGGVKFPKVHW